jgi:hypothetical protein
VWHHTVDYKAQRGGVRGALVDRGFWVHLPRLVLLCRLRGHKPVVDGVSAGIRTSRWVCCDRCGIRPEPQGVLDRAAWNVGDPVDLDSPVKDMPGGPGPWPQAPEGTLGGQLVIGGHVTAGVQVKVGNCGSEHVLAAHACVPFLGGLYLHTEGFGTWVQRRLNPVGYESKVISLAVHDGHAYWKLWAPRDGYPRHDGRQWRDGSVRVDPRDILLGERRYSYEDVTGAEPVTLLLPDGTGHQVTMKLQRQSHGRAKGRKRESWTVDCECREGIPDRHPGKSGLCGWSVAVSDAAVEAGMWQQEAVAASIVKVTEIRVRYGYKAEARVT